MSVLILGFGVSGKAVGEYLTKEGIFWRSVDREDGQQLDLSGVARVIKSPGIPYTHPWVRQVLEANLPFIGEIDLALEVLTKKNKRLLGITGSNGKTTTTLLTTHLLKRAGVNAIAAGNVGIPLISVVDAPFTVCVIELSSFQLESVVRRPALDGAALLNCTPNHLDRHKTFADYKEAKGKICELLKPEAPFFDPKGIAPFYEKVESLLPLGYRIGRHEIENLAAAYALANLIIPLSDDDVREGFETFQKPPHRIEVIREFGGITFINDSKATSVDAVKKGVESLSGRIFLIAGGVDKGGDFSQWVPLFRQKVACVFALGEARKRIARELRPEIEVEEISSLEEGIEGALKRAQKGDSVLLSPGCSSFDQFIDYRERGDRFREIVMGVKR